MADLTRVYKVGLVTSIAGLTWGYDSGIISGILNVQSFQDLMGFTPANKTALSGNIASALLYGGIPSYLFLSYLNDNLGRKKTIAISATFFLIGSIFQIFTWNLFSIYLGRGISGFGLAMLVISVAIYNSEISPPLIRGRIIGIQQLMVATGIAISYWVNYAVSVTNVEGEAAFRLPFAFQVVPCITLLIGINFIPESPRWLLSKGKTEEARESLAFVRGLPESSPQLLNELESTAVAIANQEIGPWSEVFGAKNLKRIYVGLTLLIFQQFVGQNLINYFAPTMFKDLGIKGKSADLFATGVIGIVKMVFTFPGLYLIDRVGRRPLLLVSTAIMAVAFFYIGFYSHYLQGSEIDARGYIAVACIYIFMACYGCSWGIVHYVIPGEIYPQHLRARSEVVTAFSDVFNIASTQLSPVFIANLTHGGVYFLYGGFLTFFGIWIFATLPETKGLKLEEVDIVFNSWQRWKPVEKLMEKTTVDIEDKEKP
ncbi:hypothetical protein HK103_007032 [Boothiomyces macroporosus]|uniref:Major facilitator superfamily (MFS) profile domain-containing protein n=1 Tax=Boothiomyces macroporosus TaxID=261099 RepID=A0AAD5UDL7_9FUNG|nr:hypothetical protein HK103_007032 [Boothiomyces macroporosus]